MITLYKNAKILTKVSGAAQVVDGEIAIDNDKIAYIGAQFTEKADIIKDAHGNLVIPGFKNAHAHSAMTFLRSYAEDLPLKEWLFDKVFPLENKLTADDVYSLSKLAIAEYVRNGITSAFDMYFFPESIAKAYVDTGFRGVLCGAISAFDDSAATIDFELNKLETNYNKFNAYNPLVSYQLGFHAEYTAKIPLLKGVADLSKKYKSGVYAHSSETESEVKECVERHGKTPTALFNDLGLLDNGGGYFHLTHLTNEDITLLAKNKIYSVTNPCSNLKLASGIAELEKQYKAGIKIAIGTDGAASNNALDMFRETYLAAVLAKVKTNDAAAAPADIVLNWAVGNGADAMGLPDSNALEVGKKADFVIIDLAAPNMNPHNNLIKNLVYSGNPSNVLATIIDGKTVYENGEWKTLNVAELNAEANKIIARMKA